MEFEGVIKIAEKKPKTVFTEKINCPHCRKKVIVKKTKKLITAAEKAEYEEKIVVEKDSQTTIPEVQDKKKKK